MESPEDDMFKRLLSYGFLLLTVAIPAAEPADPPIINMIAKRHRPAKPKELGSP